MKKLIFFTLTVACVGIAFSSFGQDQELKIRKNEIGLNVSPVWLLTHGNANYPNPFGLTYKRVYNKWALRANITHHFWDENRYSIDGVQAIAGHEIYRF